MGLDPVTGAAFLKFVAFAAATVAAARAKRANRNETVDDSKPATLTDRGVRLPVVIGRTRGGPVFAWEGDRFVIQEPTQNGGGGKGIGSGANGQNEVYFASGWHQIAVGPATRLRRIYENGEAIFPETAADVANRGATPQSHPSGSVLTLSQTDEGKNRGVLRIYWGEPDQPTDSLLISPGAIGANSNFGFIFHGVWTDKRLGGAGSWPAIEYEYEVRPYNPGQIYNAGAPPTYDSLVPQLGVVGVAGEPWVKNGLGVPTGFVSPEIQTVREGSPGHVPYIKVCGNYTGSATFPINRQFVPGATVEIQDNTTGVDGIYTVVNSSWDPNEVIYPLTAVAGIQRNLTQRVDDPLFWDLGTNATVADASGSVPLPPGVPSINPFGPPPTPRFNVAFSLRPVVTSGDGYVRTTLSSAPNTDPDPGGANPGNAVQFNPGTNILTFYVWDNFGGAGTSQLRVSLMGEDPGAVSVYPISGKRHSVLLTMEDATGNLTAVVEENGGKATTQFVGNGWYKVQLSYSAASNSATVPFNSVAVDPVVVQFAAIGSGSVTDNDIIIYFGNGQGPASGHDPLLQYSTEPACVGVTTVEFDENLQGIADFQGFLCPLEPNDNGYQGANAAHALYQLLFDTAPHGLGLDQNCFDFASLQDMGFLLGEANEGIRSHITIANKQSVDGGVQALLEELNTHLAWDVITGKWRFIPVRARTIDGVVESDIIQPDLPGRLRRFDELLATKIVFLYPNVDLRYRQDAVTLTEDGRAEQELREDGEKITLKTVRDPDAAIQIGELRSLWEFSKPTMYSVVLNREAAVLRPGDLLDFGDLLGLTLPLRVMSVELDPESAEVAVTVVTDPYVQNAISTASLRLGPSPVPRGDVFPVAIPLRQSRVLELSQFLGQKIRFAFLQAPSEAPAPSVSLLTGTDGLSYSSAAQVNSVPAGIMQGGFALSDYFVEEGPLIRVAPGFSNRIRSLNDADFYAGRQWMVIGDEIMYVREFLPLGGDVYQPRGILRARLDTVQQNHGSSVEVYVLSGDSPTGTFVPTAGRGSDMHYKLVPRYEDAGVVADTVYTVEGKGIKPMPLQNLATEEFLDCWVNGEDLNIRWDFRLPQGFSERSGSGMQGYGEATGTAGLDPFPGVFRVSLTNITAATPPYGPFDLTTNKWSIDWPTLFTLVSPGDTLRVDVIPVYTTGEIGDRVQLTLVNA